MFGSRGLCCCSRIWNHSLFLKRSGSFRASFATNSVVAKQKRVGTHNGTFHCDETLACFILRLSNRFSDAHIVRTRDHEVLEKLDAALDVGGVYDPQSERYDHHQKGFTEVFGNGFNTKLSSAGLVYKCVHFHAKSWLPARSIVMECLAKRYDIDSTGEIMKLSKQCPWKLHIFELEEEMKIDPNIKYVLYQDDRSENWRIQAVSVTRDRFESRKALPLSWRGLEKEKLSEESSIPGCVFVHMSGFIGANRTYEGALAMARASLMG